MITPMMLLLRRFRLTANRLGLKPDLRSASSMASRVLFRTDDGSLKYFETVGRDSPTNSENSSIVLIGFDTSPPSLPVARSSITGIRSWKPGSGLVSCHEDMN